MRGSSLESDRGLNKILTKYYQKFCHAPLPKIHWSQDAMRVGDAYTEKKYPACIHAKPQYKKLSQNTQKFSFINQVQNYYKS